MIQQIAKRIKTCLILHNIRVQERVIKDMNAVYNPAEDVMDKEQDRRIQTPRDIEAKEKLPVNESAVTDSIHNRWKQLNNPQRVGQ